MTNSVSADGSVRFAFRSPRTNRIVATAIAAAFALTGCASAPSYSGDQLFATHCASCHGRYGEGDGPVAADIARHLPDLRYIAARNGGAFPRIQVIDIIDGTRLIDAHGTRPMPIWGDAFARLDGPDKSSKAKVEALVDYLTAIQQKR